MCSSGAEHDILFEVTQVRHGGRYMSLFEHGLNPNGPGNGLYFSYGADLTLSEQKFVDVSGDSSKKGRALYARADPTFLFNRHLIEPLTGAWAGSSATMQKVFALCRRLKICTMETIWGI
jgi:SacI homology domain